MLNHLSIKQQVIILRFSNLLFSAIGILFFEFKIQDLLIFASGYYIFTRIGGDVGFHRYFCHKSFKARFFVDYILLLIGSLACIGSSLTWVGSHSAHHKHSDEAGDPHSPGAIGFLNVIFLNWSSFHFSVSSIKQFDNFKLHLFIHNYYLYYNLCFIFLLGFISLKFLVVFYCAPMLYSSFITGLVNTVCHKYGYRNYDTPDESRNNFFIHLISLGGGMHNNHHAHPKEFMDNQEKWYELDPAAYLIKYALKRN